LEEEKQWYHSIHCFDDEITYPFESKTGLLVIVIDFIFGDERFVQTPRLCGCTPHNLWLRGRVIQPQNLSNPAMTLAVLVKLTIEVH
jgi:hypothetical protein